MRQGERRVECALSRLQCQPGPLKGPREMVGPDIYSDCHFGSIIRRRITVHYDTVRRPVNLIDFEDGWNVGLNSNTIQITT